MMLFQLPASVCVNTRMQFELEGVGLLLARCYFRFVQGFEWCNALLTKFRPYAFACVSIHTPKFGVKDLGTCALLGVIFVLPSQMSDDTLSKWHFDPPRWSECQYVHVSSDIKALALATYLMLF